MNWKALQNWFYVIDYAANRYKPSNIHVFYQHSLKSLLARAHMSWSARGEGERLGTTAGLLAYRQSDMKTRRNRTVYGRCDDGTRLREDCKQKNEKKKKKKKKNEKKMKKWRLPQLQGSFSRPKPFTCLAS